MLRAKLFTLKLFFVLRNYCVDFKLPEQKRVYIMYMFDINNILQVTLKVKIIKLLQKIRLKDREYSLTVCSILICTIVKKLPYNYTIKIISVLKSE